MEARSVLGVPALRPPFLDDLPAAKARRAEADRGRVVKSLATSRVVFRCDVDGEVDDDSDDNEDDPYDTDENDDDEDDEDDEEDDVETWQVLPSGDYFP